jgi:hypothetical protein
MADPESRPALVDRLWRARRWHDHVEAALRSDESSWELQFFRNDHFLLSWTYADREAALAEAARILHDLQRAGWNVHW